VKFIILLIINIIIWYQSYLIYFAQPATYFLDIGQGDATLIQDRLTQIVIDTGPDEAILHQLNQFIPFYDKTIECIIITHPHSDHYQGLLHLLDYYHVNQIILPQIDESSQTYQFLLAKIDQLAIPTIRADNFTQLQTDTLFIQFLFPFRHHIPNEVDDLNDISNTLIVWQNNSKIIFTGDLSQKYEKQLIKKYGPNLQSDILQVGHHGSKTASAPEFLQTIQPDLAVISVGVNTFGHPAPEIMERFAQNKIEVWRTDLDGTFVYKWRDTLLLFTYYSSFPVPPLPLPEFIQAFQ